MLFGNLNFSPIHHQSRHYGNKAPVQDPHFKESLLTPLHVHNLKEKPFSVPSDAQNIPSFYYELYKTHSWLTRPPPPVPCDLLKGRVHVSSVFVPPIDCREESIWYMDDDMDLKNHWTLKGWDTAWGWGLAAAGPGLAPLRHSAIHPGVRAHSGPAPPATRPTFLASSDITREQSRPTFSLHIAAHIWCMWHRSSPFTVPEPLHRPKGNHFLHFSHKELKVFNGLSKITQGVPGTTLMKRIQRAWSPQLFVEWMKNWKAYAGHSSSWLWAGLHSSHKETQTLLKFHSPLHSTSHT